METTRVKGGDSVESKECRTRKTKRDIEEEGILKKKLVFYMFYFFVVVLFLVSEIKSQRIGKGKLETQEEGQELRE